MKNLLFLLLSSVLCSQAFSWNTDGHILIVDLAVDNLNAEQTRNFERISRRLENTFSTEDRLFLLRNYDSSSDLAKIAAFPDRVRNQSLKEVFANWQLEVPAPLAHLAEQNTANWHYKNHPYYSGVDEAPQCDIADPINIASIFPLLIESYDQASEDVERALLLSFIIHMVADAHQPMHSVSRVDKDCNHDLGGNLYCAAEPGIGGRCDENLHSLWDGAVGLFDSVDTYPELYDLHDNTRVPVPATDIYAMDEWLSEGYESARLIYTLRENKRPDDFYIEDGQHIAYTRVMQAANRLAEVLKSL